MAEPFETELEAMPDDAVTRLYNSLEVDDPRCDLVAGEMERRNLDD